MSAVVPYGFPTELEAAATLVPLPGQVQCLKITFASEILDFLLATITGWFAGRDEVVLVDYGTTDKQGLGFLVLEWRQYSIDPVFPAILRDAEFIADYTVYGRPLEG